MPLDTFGGGATHPSDISFRTVVLTEDLTLEWPSLSTSSSDVTARVMELLPQAAGFSVTLPDARQVAEGQDILFRNIADEDVVIKDNGGGTIATVAAGQVKYFYLTSNTSAAGAWGVVQFGVGSSSADASLLAGLGLKAIGTTLNQKYDVVETTSDIEIKASDRAKLYAYTGGTHTIELPPAASVGSDFFFLVKNGGAGTVTVIADGTETIDLSTSLLIQPNDGVIIFSGGSANKWYTVAQGRAVQFAFTQLVKNVGGATDDVTLTSSEAQNKVITFTGTLVQSIDVVVPNTVSVYYVFNNTSGPHSLSVRTADGTGVAITQGAREIAVCDGNDVRRGVDNTAATTLFSVGSETAPSVTFVTDSDTGFYHPGQNMAGITAGGVDVMRFTGVSSGVNAFEAFAASTGQPAKLSVFGDDADISALFTAKGNGEILFEDDEFTVRNAADTTKKVCFDCSAISTANKRTLTVPDASGIVVVADAQQTLSNKNYESAVFTGEEPKEDIAGVGDVLTCPSGAVIPFAGIAEPSGWVFCYGQELSRTSHARLFAIIGTTYGAGDGINTFNVPDLRGRVPAGLDSMGGTSANRLSGATAGSINGDVLGGFGGEEHHVLTVAELAAHAHGVNDPGHAHSIPVTPSTQQADGSTNTPTAANGATSTGVAGTGISIQNAGSSNAHNNVQPTLILQYIIKC